MDKDGSVKLGTTKCDYCNNPAVVAVGKLVLCAAHKSIAISCEKQASDDRSLKAAPIELADKHDK